MNEQYNNNSENPQNPQNEQENSTYHRSYLNDSDPNAKTYISSGNEVNNNINQTQSATGTQQTTGTQPTGAQQRPYVTYNPNGTSQNAYSPSQNAANSNQTAYGYQNTNTSQYGNPQTYATYQNAAKPKKKEKKEHKGAKFFGKAVAFGAIAGCIVVGMTFGYFKISGVSTSGNKVATTTTGTVKTTSSSNSKSESGNVSTIVKDVMPSIVSITSTFQASNSNSSNDFYNWFYGGGNSSGSSEQQGSGSGIVISETDDELMVVTNNHVIADDTYGTASKVQVTFSDDNVVDATIKGRDSDADLAVLTVKKADMKADTLSAIKIAVLGNSDSMSVGDDVIAIGNALGYGQSVTTGVVSALNREVQLTDKTMTLLQTDAAINPGNSGGALLNMNGEVIGINSVKYASDEVEGMGYAIPMSIAQPIIEDLMNEEAVSENEQAYLGIYGSDVSSDLASAYNMPEGVWVSSVSENSPAAKAGIQQRDIITKFNNHNISSMTGLQEQIAKKKAGTKVTVTVKRQDSNGEYKEKEIEVTLGKKSEASSSNNSQSNGQSNGNSSNGNNSNGQSNDNSSSNNGSSSFDEFFGR